MNTELQSAGGPWDGKGPPVAGFGVRLKLGVAMGC